MSVHTDPVSRAPVSRRMPPAALAAVLALQAGLSLRLRNSVFQDEALYLYAGDRLARDGLGAVPEFARFFSGLPHLYPVIGAAFDRIGGLALARLFSLACMLAATWCVFRLTERLTDRDTAVLASVAFAPTAPVLFVGHLATYDAMCIALVAGACLGAVVAGDAGRAAPAAASGVLLAAAIATKYAALLFAPAVLALVVATAWPRPEGRRRAVTHAALAGAAAVAGIGLTLALVGTGVLEGLSTTTTSRDPVFVESAGVLLGRVVRWAGITLALAVIGGWIHRRRNPVLVAVLLGAATLAPAYHALTGEAVSLQKHAAFSLVFAAPLAGVALARLAGAAGTPGTARRVLAAASVCLALAAAGAAQSTQLFRDWADSDTLVEAVRTQVRPGAGLVLAEEYEVLRYRLRDVTEPWQWQNLYVYDYDDPVTGTRLTGLPAYRAAIRDGVFDTVVLSYTALASTSVAITPDLDARYERVLAVPRESRFGRSESVIWRRRTG